MAIRASDMLAALLALDPADRDLPVCVYSDDDARDLGANTCVVADGPYVIRDADAGTRTEYVGRHILVTVGWA